MAIAGGMPLLQAQLVPTHQGATMMSEPFHTAAPTEPTDTDSAGRLLGLSIFVILFGGFLHALYTLRDEKPVHITIKKKVKAKKEPVLSERWFWMEIKV